MATENDDNTPEASSLHSLVRRLTEIGEFYMRDRASADDQYAWDVSKAEVRRLLHELACLSQHDRMIIWIAGEIQERVGWRDEWPDAPNDPHQARTTGGSELAG